MKKVLLTLLLSLLTLQMFAQTSFLGSWSGKLSLGQSSLTVVINLSKNEAGEYVCTMDSPDQGAKGIKAEASIENGIVLNVNVPSVGASYKGVLFNKAITGTFSQLGNEFPLTLKPAEEEVLNRPQTPVGPFPYTEEEVIFTNVEAGATLAGSLIIPEGATKDTPVVLMVTGSGLEDRNEEVYDHKPFLVIADHLARNGIATLRYDDRTYGKSQGGDVQKATTLDFMEDAKAGLGYLKSRGQFGQIGVLGHSEGGSIAFMLGVSQDADFVISLAGIGVKGDEALTAQANKILELAGSDQRYTVEAYRTNALAQGNAWLAWFLNYDPVPDVEVCKCPVFAANGTKDIQVISSLNLASIKAHLASGAKNMVKEYEGLNHLFQHCETGNVTEYRGIEETCSPELLTDLSAWINSLAGH